MTLQKFRSIPEIETDFAVASLQSKPKKKRASPLSLRLSDDERALLEDKAGRQSLSGYIKDRLFAEDSSRRKTKRHRVVQDYEALARVLSALGQTELFANLSNLNEQVENGNVVLTPEVEEQIGVACACVLLMRNDLVTALGLQAE